LDITKTPNFCYLLKNFLSYPLGKFEIKPPPPIGFPDPSIGGGGYIKWNGPLVDTIYLNYIIYKLCCTIDCAIPHHLPSLEEVPVIVVGESQETKKWCCSGRGWSA
jgi:hypothetical protein